MTGLKPVWKLDTQCQAGFNQALIYRTVAACGEAKLLDLLLVVNSLFFSVYLSQVSSKFLNHPLMSLNSFHCA